MSTLEERADVLRSIPEEERYRLGELLKHGPGFFQRLTGRRPHRSKCQRAHYPGSLGITLRVVDDGGRRYTCLAWVAQWLVEVAAARAARRGAKKASKPKRRPRRVNR